MDANNEETQTFHLFPDLPLELRRKIWRRTLPLFPRIIEVRPRTTPTEAWNPLTTKHHVRATAPRILLSINREARQELLPFHTALSSNVSLNQIPDSDSATPNLSAKPPMVNFEVDTIYFNVAWSTTESVPYLSFVQRLFQNFEKDKRRVRRLAVDYNSELVRFNLLVDILGEDNTGQDDTEYIQKSVVCKFDDLAELSIVLEQRHLRVKNKLIGLVEDKILKDPEVLQNLKDCEGQLKQGWRIPKIWFCSTVAVPIEKQRVESQSSYLERIYGSAFVERFMAQD
ncbi:hypothetical protein NHQ30_009851 [Ciborinia camelliae]|nr:hypothetical protein NHQ30_009851 [Ciborinia camelliae]